ncbi:MAG: potassium channel family protein [Chloroflexota bacterium]
MKRWLERLIRQFGRFLLWDLVRDERTRPLFIWVGLLIVLGTVIFHWLEGWSLVDSFYFSVISLTTVGYGDFTPTTTLAKLIAVFYVLNGVGVILAFLDTAAEVRRDRIKNLRNQS